MAPLLAHRPGVDRAFERLYRRHALDVYRYAQAVLRNQADAEDVTQTTFMNAYRALERGERPESPHNWLIAIAHNVCRQRFRAASRRPQEVMIEDDVADHLVQPEDDDAPSPEDIKRALSHLAFNQRAALVMRELEGRSYTEIADLLGVSVSAVETLIFRARRALREQLEATLTCGQAELLLSRQLDGELGKDERAQLRAHVRACAACRKLARSHRAQRSALRSLGALPLPSSLASLLGGTAPVATKVAVAVVTASVASGVGYDLHHQLSLPKTHSTPPPAAVKHGHPATPTKPAKQVAGSEAAGAAVTPASATAHPTAAHHVRVRHHGKPAWARHPQPQPVTTVATPAATPPTVTHPSHPAQSHAPTRHPATPSHGKSGAPPKKKTGNPHAAPALTKSSHTKAASKPGSRHLHP
jgi:RNA polymerase sigma factor (sigma-70 family)